MAQGALLLQLECGEGDQAVSVDHSSEVIDGDHPVAVAVEGKAESGTVLHHSNCEGVGVGGTAVIIDVAAVG